MRRDRIGFVFQSFNLVPTLTAGENITLPADLAGQKVDKEWFDYLVDQLGIADRLSHRPSEMSGGQQQRCACARALINRPDLVFADEPTGNLDSNSSTEMLSFLRRSVTEFGQSIVMVTHDPHGAAYADRVVFLADGNIVDELVGADGRLGARAHPDPGQPDMWRVTIKGLLAHKLRLALTALAIVLGVTFIAGTFVLTDTLHSTFDNLFGNIYQNVDFQVRGVAQLGTSGGNATRNPVPESLLAHGAARSRRGGRRRLGDRLRAVRRPRRQGHHHRRGTDPRASRSTPTSRSPRSTLRRASPPTTPTRRRSWTSARRRSTTSRSASRCASCCRARPGRSPSPAWPASARPTTWPGPPWPPSTSRRRRRSWARSASSTTSTSSPHPGADKAAVQRDIARVLPRGVEVVTGQTVVNEQTSAISQALGFFNTALLVFGFIALFVGGFTILNTFSITVGQRTKELALLRIVGASRRQVFRSVLGEAVIVGAGVVADRPRARRARRHRAREAAERLRRHAAVGPARVRDPHRRSCASSSASA